MKILLLLSSFVFAVTSFVQFKGDQDHNEGVMKKHLFDYAGKTAALSLAAHFIKRCFFGLSVNIAHAVFKMTTLFSSERSFFKRSRKEQLFTVAAGVANAGIVLQALSSKRHTLSSALCGALLGTAPELFRYASRSQNNKPVSAQL